MTRTDDALAELGSLGQSDVSLGPWCTYRVGGRAAVFVEATSVADLEAVHRAVTATGCPTLVVGRGSNLLVADAGFDGIVVHLGGAFDEITIEGERVIAGGAALLPVVARQSVKAGLTGFEWAVGVPGSVGGSVRMNAGGHGSDMAASLVRVSLFDFETGGPDDVPASDLGLGYRQSLVGPSQIVLFAELALRHGDQGEAEETLREIVRWRRANQPGGPNAGSVFANPPGDSAGRLIDAAGLKGHRIGTASVSTKHANFIQADPDGSADDVYALIRHIQARIADTVGLHLEPENRLIGFDGATTEDDDVSVTP